MTFYGWFKQARILKMPNMSSNFLYQEMENLKDYHLTIGKTIMLLSKMILTLVLNLLLAMSQRRRLLNPKT